MILKGQKVHLIPANKTHKQLFFEMATHSEATPFWYGHWYGDTVPDEQKFFSDWEDHYFGSDQSVKGHCFMIEAEGRIIGQVNYNAIDLARRHTDLDIIIAGDTDKGKGYGKDAMKTLMNFLHEHFGLVSFQVDVALENGRAVRAYEKAGFRIRRKYHRNGNDWVSMVALWKAPAGN